MRTSIGQRQVQLQKLSPQQIQLMKLLQVPTALLEQRIKEELEENPALEEGGSEITEEYTTTDSEDSFSEADNSPEDTSDDGIELEDTMDLDSYLNEYMDDDQESYKLRGDSYNPEEEERSIPIAVENTFHDYLEQQIGMLDLATDKDIAIARQLVGSIDEDGYLRRDPESLVDDLMFSQNIFTTKKEVLAILKKIQRFDPAGVGARDLQECLLIQLALKMEQEDELEDEELTALQCAYRIIHKYFDAFSKKHFDKLQRSLNIEEDGLRAAMEEILKLNPKPASAYTGGGSSSSNQYVIPDFIIVNRENELEVVLNSRNAPELRISDQFREMLKSYARNRKEGRVNRAQKDAVKFIRQKIESARWFIDAIRQRHETMYKAMYAILQYQYDYFLTGDQKKLRPMILQDIADITGLDVSTVSRVANSKFVQTEFGTKRLKDFFSESLQNSEGEEVSTLEVKKILSEIINGENKRRPLSDDKLTAMLMEKGYNIARRTVAKYRDQLNIPKASLRKEL